MILSTHPFEHTLANNTIDIILLIKLQYISVLIEFIIKTFQSIIKSHPKFPYIVLSYPQTIYYLPPSLYFFINGQL